MKYVIGNLKSHKNLAEAHGWLEAFTSHDVASLDQNVSVVICPPSPFLLLFKEALASYSHISIGSQDISQFGAGKYTGEMSAFTLRGIVTHALIGHSERRTYFHETNATVSAKVDQAQSMQITPVVLVRNEHDLIPDGVNMIAYEPVEAIGSGHNMSVEDVSTMKRKLGIDQSKVFIYGGSVTSLNVRDYLSHTEIQGVLPGTSTLDPHEFYSLLERASYIPTQ